MKSRVIIPLLVLFLAASLPLMGQEESGSTSGKKKFKDESDYFYVSVQIQKIYSTYRGYVVSYRTSNLGLAQAYLPVEWFEGTAKKGEVVKQGSASAWPRLLVFYKNGEFSHVRLMVHKERFHSTWGMIPQGINLDDKFDGVEEVKLQF
jgi:hypothetical protein